MTTMQLLNLEDQIRALQELIDCVRMQEIEACARVCESYIAPGIGQEMAVAIRARKEKQ